MMKAALLVLALLLAPVLSAEEASTVVDIVNFVCGCEPRDPKTDLVTPLREEIALNTRTALP